MAMKIVCSDASAQGRFASLASKFGALTWGESGKWRVKNLPNDPFKVIHAFVRHLATAGRNQMGIFGRPHLVVFDRFVANRRDDTIDLSHPDVTAAIAALEEALDRNELHAPAAIAVVEGGVRALGVDQVARTRGPHFFYNWIGEVEAPLTVFDRTGDEGTIAKAAGRFFETQVRTRAEDLDRHNGYKVLVRDILPEAAEQGFLGPTIPESFGGTGLPKVALAHMALQWGGDSTFTNTLGAHISLWTTSVLRFASLALMQQLLPDTAAGKRYGCFALTEAGSGSDVAQTMKSTAVCHEDGYILNGEKCFITNANFAHGAIFFAKLDGKVRAFVVDLRNENGQLLPGVKIEASEDKVGQRGTSTATIRLDNVKVPEGNLLDASGLHVMLYTLFAGRSGIAMGSIAHMQFVLKQAIAWAKERAASGVKTTELAAVKGLITSLAMKISMLSSLSFRTMGDMERDLAAIEPGPEEQAAQIGVAFRHGPAASMSKVYASEVAESGAKEAMQIVGGMGYVEQVEIGRVLRDAHVYSIYEGTTQVNEQQSGRALLQGDPVFFTKEGYADRLKWVDAKFGDHPLHDAIRRAEIAKEMLIRAQTLIGKDTVLLGAATDKADPQFLGVGQLVNESLARLYMSALVIESKVLGALKVYEGYYVEELTAFPKDAAKARDHAIRQSEIELLTAHHGSRSELRTMRQFAERIIASGDLNSSARLVRNGLLDRLDEMYRDARDQQKATPGLPIGEHNELQRIADLVVERGEYPLI